MILSISLKLFCITLLKRIRKPNCVFAHVQKGDGLAWRDWLLGCVVTVLSAYK